MLGVSLGLAAPARAHIDLDFPTERKTNSGGQKTGPCGDGAGTRSANVTTYAPGSTITVKWRETIQHPGHFRIWFDQDGVDDFTCPTSATDYITNNPLVLDNIADGTTQVQFTLPNVECDNCTLQLVQVMTDKGGNGFGCTGAGGDDLYFRCADLELKAGVTNPTPPATGSGGADGGVDATATTAEHSGHGDTDASAVPMMSGGGDCSVGGANPAAVLPIAMLLLGWWWTTRRRLMQTRLQPKRIRRTPPTLPRPRQR